MITQERLKELFFYDPETGVFTNLVTRGPRAIAGEVAGSLNVHGYIAIIISKRVYLAHRLAYLYMNGNCPDYLDHKNRVRTDNRISNLSPASPADNAQNRGFQSNNTSGFIGVCFSRRDQKWQASISVAYRRKHIGLFDTPEEASAAYQHEKRVLHSFRPALIG